MLLPCVQAKRRSSTAGARMRVVAAPTSLNAAGAHRRDLLLGGSSSDEDEDFAMDEDDPEFAAYREARFALYGAAFAGKIRLKKGC